MPETGYFEIEAAEISEAHHPLGKVLIRHHQPKTQDVGRSVTHEDRLLFPGKEDEMTFGVSRCMDDQNSTCDGKHVLVSDEDVGLHGDHRRRLRCDHHPKEKSVQGSWRRGHPTHGLARGDEDRISPMHVDPTFGESLELGQAPGMVRMTVGHQNVSDIGDVPSHGMHRLTYQPLASDHSRIHQDQTIRLGIEKEGVDPRQTDLIQAWL
jgi:hypothetical protein